MSDINLDKKFDEKYRDILNTLRALPRKTAEEKEERCLWLKSHSSYNDFISDFVKCFRDMAYRKWEKNVNESGFSKIVSYDDSGHDIGVASAKWWGTDPVVMMESVWAAVQDYVGESKKGKQYTFCQSVRLKYSQLAGKASAENDKGIISSDNNPVKIAKLVKTVKAALEKLETNSKDLKTIVMEYIQDCPYRVSKKEIEEIIWRVNGLDIIGSLNSVNNEDDIEPLENIVGEDPFSNWDEKLEEKPDNKKLVMDAWEKVKDAINISNKEVLQVFMSKNILIHLKLYQVPEQSIEEYRPYLEPKCGQWCPKEQGSCPYGKNKPKGCYVRYGIAPDDDKTGSDKYYALYKSCADFIYKNILNNPYVKFAYNDSVNNLEDMYVRPLKASKDGFEFTDAIISKVCGYNKSDLSKWRKKYETKTKLVLNHIFLDH